MSVSFPMPPDHDGAGEPPGAIKLFFGGAAFLLVMLLAYVGSLWRGNGRT